MRCGRKPAEASVHRELKFIAGKVNALKVGLRFAFLVKTPSLKSLGVLRSTFGWKDKAFCEQRRRCLKGCRLAKAPSRLLACSLGHCLSVTWNDPFSQKCSGELGQVAHSGPQPANDVT